MAVAQIPGMGSHYEIPDLTEGHDPGSLRIKVVFTTIAGTLAALNTAENLANGLNAEIGLLVTQVIYFRYPIESPPVPTYFFEKLCHALVDELGLGARASLEGREVNIEIHLCRDQLQCLRDALTPRSIVVIGAARKMWPRRERKLERALKGLGHDAILVHADPSHGPQSQSVINRMLPELTARVHAL